MLSRRSDRTGRRLDGTPSLGERRLLRELEGFDISSLVLLAGAKAELSSRRFRTANVEEDDGTDFDDFPTVRQSSDGVRFFDQKKASLPVDLKVDFADEAVENSQAFGIA